MKMSRLTTTILALATLSTAAFAQATFQGTEQAGQAAPIERSAPQAGPDQQGQAYQQGQPDYRDNDRTGPMQYPSYSGGAPYAYSYGYPYAYSPYPFAYGYPVGIGFGYGFYGPRYYGGYGFRGGYGYGGGYGRGGYGGGRGGFGGGRGGRR